MGMVEPNPVLPHLCMPNQKACRGKGKKKRKEVPNQPQVPVAVNKHQQQLVRKQNYVEDSVYQCERVDSV